MSAKNLSVFSDVIMSLAVDAVAEIEGIELLRSADKCKKNMRGCGVSVYFLPNEKVSIDIFVNIKFGCSAPVKVAEVQEKVKAEVEGATKYRVHTVNVQIVSVIFG